MTARAFAILLIVPAVLLSEETPAPTDLARTIHGLILPKIPKQHEDLSGWGKTIPLPAELRRPGLKRTVIKVGDRMEVPQGNWTRTKVWLDDPGRDVQLRVVEQRKLDATTNRLVLEATVNAHGERQQQQWLKGLRLLDLTARGDAVVLATFDVDMSVTLKPRKLLPEVSIDAKVVRTKLELKQFDLQRVGVGPLTLGNKESRGLGAELKSTLQDWLREYEPAATVKLNDTLSKALLDGKGKLFLPKP